MKSLGDTAPEISRLEDASAWLQRLHASENPILVEQWADWCAKDPANLVAFERVQETWNGFPNGLRLSDEGRQSNRANRPRRVLIGLAASLAALLVAITSIAFEYPRSRIFATTSQQRHDQLPDGSQVDLAPNSRLSVRFSLWKREIRLDNGQAYFAVARETLRPFVVHANGLTAVSSGTAFDVRTARNATVVTVSEGRISVQLTGKGESVAADGVSAPVFLHAGEQATLSGIDRRLNVSTVDPAVAESWRSGMLEFVHQPLGAVVNEVDRFVSRRIVVASALQDARYSGTVSPVNVADWLEALKQIYSVQVVDEGTDEIYIRARSPYGVQDRS